MSDANLQYCVSGRDSTVQLLLIVLNIIFTFITAILSTIKLNARCPCMEFSSRPANAPSTPMPIALGGKTDSAMAPDGSLYLRKKLGPAGQGASSSAVSVAMESAATPSCRPPPV